MTVEEVFQDNPDLQDRYMDLVRSHRRTLELMHPPEEVEVALSSYVEMKKFSDRAAERIEQYPKIDKIDTQAIIEAMETRMVAYAPTRLDVLPEWLVGSDEPPQDDEPPFEDLKITGFGPEVPK
jgi:hypothetical protein